ncbi:MAG TPA: hypothetical protein VGF74_14960 [Thermoleophilaceae bacterium]|jgi:hypothetical protein
MALTIEDRGTTSDELVHARERLATAFAERDRARERYEAALGTSCELGAYMRLRQAGQQVAACDKWLRWAESENPLETPRPEHTPLDELFTL